MENNRQVLINLHNSGGTPSADKLYYGEIAICHDENQSAIYTKVSESGIAKFVDETQIVNSINLANYTQENDEILVSGDFVPYIKSEDEEYLSSHHRFLMYNGSVVRFDCFAHSMVTDDMNKGNLYSMMLKKGDGVWSLQGYVSEDVGMLNPDFSEKIYNDSDAEANQQLADADKQQTLDTIRKAFGEPYNNENGKYIPYTSYDTDNYEGYILLNDSISVKDTQNSNAVVTLNGQQVLVSKNLANKLQYSSHDSESFVTLTIDSGDMNDMKMYSLVGIHSDEDDVYKRGLSVQYTIDSTNDGGAKMDVSTQVSTMNVKYDLNIDSNDRNIEVGLGNGVTSEMINSALTYYIVFNETDDGKSVYALNDGKLNNDYSNPAFIATEKYVDDKIGDINTILENVLNVK